MQTVKLTKFRQWIRERVKSGQHSGECTCGRGLGTLIGYSKTLTYQPHCPDCGSGWTMGKRSASKLIQLDDGSVIDSAGIVCRKCSREFDEYTALLECQAPPSREMSKRINEERSAKELVEQRTGVSLDNFKEELNKLRVARGEEPLP